MACNYFLNFLLLLLLGCQSEISQKNSSMNMYTEKTIIDDLDNAYLTNPYKFFPELGDGYLYLSGSRINLYADDTRWAMAIERTGYHNRDLEAKIVITYFGNCLIHLDREGADKEFIANTKEFTVIDLEDFKRVMGAFEIVSDSATSIKVRKKLLPIEHDKEKYFAKGLKFKEYKNPGNDIDFPSLVRYLNEEYPDMFCATEEELRTCIPKDLPKLMVINEWYHKDYIADFFTKVYEIGTRPGEYETFPLIAKILVTKDTSQWKPTLAPNNNWRNWPQAGSF